MPLDKEVSPTSLSEGEIAELLILVEFDNLAQQTITMRRVYLLLGGIAELLSARKDNLAEQAVWQRLAGSLAG